MTELGLASHRRKSMPPRTRLSLLDVDSLGIATDNAAFAATVAQLAEQIFRKDQVAGSNPVGGFLGKGLRG